MSGVAIADQLLQPNTIEEYNRLLLSLQLPPINCKNADILERADTPMRRLRGMYDFKYRIADSRVTYTPHP